MKKRGFLRRVFTAAALAATTLSCAASPQMGATYQGVDDTTRGAAGYGALVARSDDPVGIQLVLAMDISGSMSPNEYEVELMATAEALNSQLVRTAIKYKYGENSIAVAVIDFSNEAAVRIPWIDIRGYEINDKPYKPGEAVTSAAPDKLDALANQIMSLPRRDTGGTSIHTATDLSARVFASCPWEVKEKRVLDVFGDGQSYNTPALETSRERLASMGVTINAFAIVNEEPKVEDYFKEYLVTNDFTRSLDGKLVSTPGRVWAVARNLQAVDNDEGVLKSFFGEVTRGMKQKITVEISSVDEYRRIMEVTGEKQDRPIPLRVNPALQPRPQAR